MSGLSSFSGERRLKPNLRLLVAVVVLLATGCVGTLAYEPISAVTRAATVYQLGHPFMLPSASGEVVSLESYVGKSNVVLVFYQGFW